MTQKQKIMPLLSQLLKLFFFHIHTNYENTFCILMTTFRGWHGALAHHKRKKANNLKFIFYIFRSLYYEDKMVSLTKTKKFTSTEKNHISLKEIKYSTFTKLQGVIKFIKDTSTLIPRISLLVEDKGLSP